MRIAVDATAFRSLRHGVGMYIASMLSHLAQADAGHHYAVFASANARAALESIALPAGRTDFHYATGIRPLRILWEQLLLARAARKLRADVLWGCHNSLPRHRTCPQVVTVHDLGMLTVPQFYPASKVAYFRWALPRAARQADLVVADSEFTRQQLTAILGVPESRTRTILCGIGSQFRPVTDSTVRQRMRDRYRLPARFIFALGVPEPKKNLERIIAGYGRLPAGIRAGVKLVIGGGRDYGWKNKRVYELARQVGADVMFTDFISEDDLPVIYGLAHLFVFPSLYEGFGFPPVEAMACGTPVISSNAASLREVVAEAALVVDPTSVEEITAAMQRLIDDDVLRDELRAKGLVNARRFDWRLAAAAMLRVFAEVKEN